MALLLLGSALRWGGHVMGRIKANYCFWQCMRHRVPQGTLAWDEAQGQQPAQIWAWKTFYSEWSGTGLLTNATLFVHERKSRSGNRRLIAVDLVSVQSTTRELVVQARMFQPPVGWAPAQLRRNDARVLELPRNARTLQVFQGAPDPQDESHFTIEYESSGRRGIIDGWLSDDDHVALEPREHPVTAPSSVKTRIPTSQATSR
jgi:hypothetical protein